MAGKYKFDPDKHKATFEQMFGKGSYSSGLAEARELGRTKAQAAIQKQLFMEEFKKRKKEQEEYDLYGQSEKSWKAQNEAQGKITSQQEKAQAQGRGGHLPTRENQMKERKAIEAAKKKPIDPTSMTPYAREQLRKEKEEKANKAGDPLKKLKNFFTSKDTDGDGERDGLLGVVDRFVTPISKGATDFLIPGNTENMAKYNPDNPVIKAAQKDRGTETKVLNAAGMLAAAVSPYSQGYKVADVAFNKVPKLAKIANPYARSAIKGAAAGAIAEAGISATNELANPEAYSAKDYAIRSGIGAVGGAVLDPAILKIANIIKGARKAPAQATEEVLGLPAPKNNQSNPLGLPEPQMRLPEPKPLTPNLQRLAGLKNPIPPMPKALRQPLNQARLESKGLGFGIGSKYEPKASNRMMMPESTQNQTYWQKRYEDFSKHVNSNYDMNRMTPEALEDLWTQFARYDEPVKLDEVIDLAYPKGFEASTPSKQEVPEIIRAQEAPESDLKDALRADPRLNKLVKGLFPPQKPISRVATPGEMFKFMEDAVATQKRTPEEILKPLQFKRSIAAEQLNKGPLNDLLQPLNAINKARAEVSGAAEQIKPANAVTGGNLIDLQAGTVGKTLIPSTETKIKNINPEKLKDINGIQGYMSDIYRNTRDVFGDKFPEIKKSILDPFDKSKKEYVELQENWLNKLEKEVVKGLGIKKGSKLSKLVQDYGEKTISLDDLKQAAPNDWKKVVKADEWFRKAYDGLIDQVNASRMAIYPNNPDKLVPKRQDYYRHFNELDGLEGLKNIFDTPAGIDPKLVGTSDFTNPNSKWAGFMQRRGLGPYKSDAVGGFLNYLPSASYAVKIDPHIPKFKQFTESLKGATGSTKNLNHYIEFLEDFTRDLSGKTNFIDRPVQKVLGRRTFKGLTWLNNRVKKNAVLGNLGSTLAQVANIPNGIAFAKQYAAPGAARTLKAVIKKDEAVAKSGFLKERFSNNMYSRFNTKLIEQPEKFAGWVMSQADRMGTTFIWNSAYEKGLAQKVEDPIKFADDATRNLVAGRGIGEVPMLQKSKTFQFIAPFQLEVANLWQVQRDFIKEKDFGAIVTLYLGAWLFNKGMEETRGSKIVFDPIDAITDAFTDEDLSGWERAGRVGGEVLSNVPLGQTLANFYPEYGNDFLPTREDFFGDRDPNRFGSGLLVAKGVQDPLAKLLLPFGGTQVQKTYKGLDALRKEAVYNKAGDRLKYPVSPDFSNSAKGLLFGPGAFRETRDFYDNNRTPLGTKQTEEYERNKSIGTEEEFYNWVMQQRLKNKK
jgi:hypothetical protein